MNTHTSPGIFWTTSFATTSLAMGLNEAAGYGEVAATDMATPSSTCARS
ncbi:hypothetical protein [Streptomyces umbrinus]|nr:hypothetical protein [Streptomyces umbrinus]